MPQRLTPLVTGEYYHIFNRGVNKQPIFFNVRDYRRAVDQMRFYSYSTKKPKYSRFLTFSVTRRLSILSLLEKDNKKLVEIICYCLMPNHFHLLLRQKEDGGISNYMRLVQNSYTRYVNTAHDRTGPLLQGQFKAVRIEDNSQLLHLSRYIHLNPYTSYIVKDIPSLTTYTFSSFLEFQNKAIKPICNKDIILTQFSKDTSYNKFVEEYAAYQRTLSQIKHLLLEK